MHYMLSQELIIHMIQTKHVLAIRQCIIQVHIIITSLQLGNTIKISLGLSVTLLSKMCKIISTFYTIVHTSKIHKLPMYFNITNCELYFGLVIQEYFPIIKYQYSVNSNLVTMFYWPSKNTLTF